MGENMGHIGTNAELLLYRLHESTVLIDRLYTPILCLLGGIGNSLSLLVFCMDSQYRSQSASYYLSALALSDTGYLINLFAVWLESVRELVITSDFICPMVMYLGQVTCFLSIYLIVAFSVERYVAVHYPLSRVRICTRSKARKTILGLTVIALLLFSYAWIIARVVELDHPAMNSEEDRFEEQIIGYLKINDKNGSIPNERTVVYRCSVPEEYYYVSGIANYIDTCVTLVIPFLLISFFNGRIAWSMWKLMDITRETVVSPRNNIVTPTSSASNGSVEATHHHSRRHDRCRILSFFRWATENRERTAIHRGSTTSAKEGVGESLEMTEVEVTAIGVITTEGCKAVNKADDNNGEGTAQDVSLQEVNTDESQIETRIVQPCHLRKHQTVALSTPSEIRVTKTLLLVSFVFLLLNLPLHVVRCAQFIQTLTSSPGDSLKEEEPEADWLELFLPTAQLWANMLFNTNFAVNFLLYCVNGRNFRKSLRKIFEHRILRRNQSLRNSMRTANTERQYCVRRAASASATQEE